ncbi:MAG: AMP-binding protein [Alphaproteobacteria bacterium]|nr:AMP-binding protein [Alphaproteobacteria bacterium]
MFSSASPFDSESHPVPFPSIGQMIQARVAQSGDRVAFRNRRGAAYVDVTWADAAARMERIGAGLLTAMDMEHNAAVSIIGNNSMDWVLCDFAAQLIGLRTVPVYASLLPAEVGYMHVDTQAVLAIAEDAGQVAKLREMREGFTFFEKSYGPAQVKLQRIVVMNPEGLEPADDWESLEELEARGEAELEATRAEREDRLGKLRRDQTATYTYTSGTTGPPKAVIQTHHNMLSMLESIESMQLFPEVIKVRGLFFFLPCAHSFGRLIELGGPYFDAPLVMATVPTLGEDLKLSTPGFFPAAPRVYEKMKSKIESTVAGAPPARQKIFRWAIRTGAETIPYRSRGQELPFGLKLRNGLANRLVHSKLRAALGLEEAGLLLSGSAPLSVEVHEFFLALGLDLMEAYGLTETCPGLTTNQPGAFRLGSVGQPFPGVTIRIAEDGEILAKGPNITSGYLNRPEATADAFDEEGWFHTGDLGSEDAEGFIKITGRKKELIKTSGGKYVAPAKIEGRLKNLPIIQEAVVVGDTRNYCVCLISVDPEELAEWAKQQGVAADAGSEPVRAAIQAHIDGINDGLASFESIKYFRVLPEPLSVENGLLTASLKVKRKVVETQYADLISEMYQSGKR